MEDYAKALKESLVEMEKLLSAKNVVGEPVTTNGSTIIPLVSSGFTLGAGGGVGKPTTEGGEPESGKGAGVTGMTRPVAVVIVDKEGHVRVERIHTPGPFRTLADAVFEAASSIRRSSEPNAERERNDAAAARTHRPATGAAGSPP